MTHDEQDRAAHDYAVIEDRKHRQHQYEVSSARWDGYVIAFLAFLVIAAVIGGLRN
jgi:Mn2+/Fe2+ NRAMP family transporter